MTTTLPGFGLVRTVEDAVAYTVRTTEPVRLYLRQHTGLSRQGRLKLMSGVFGLLRDHGDVYRLDHSRRLAPNSPCFRLDYVFSDAGDLWRADCVVDDSAAAFGVLTVVYLDCQP